MDAKRRKQRDSRIVRLWEDGIGVERIASIVKLLGPRVRHILKAKGHTLGRQTGLHPVTRTLWENDRVDLRTAIARRASEAARIRLAELGLNQGAAQVSPTINSIHRDLNKSGVAQAKPPIAAGPNGRS
jgi:hypothetical protein